jgi:NADP-dependent aldehyde dehydrogenase
LIESPSAHAFIEHLAKLLDDTPPGVMLHKGIRSAYADGVKRLEKTPNVHRLAECDLSDAGPGDAHAKPTVFQTAAKTFLSESTLKQEVFGPCALAVLCENQGEMLQVAKSFKGELTASLHGRDKEFLDASELVSILEDRVGRLVFNGFPTGVEVVPAMNHGGPYPATTDVHFTSVGTATIHRYSRPICYQGCPDDRLPDALKNDNPLGIWRTVDGELMKKAIEI